MADQKSDAFLGTGWGFPVLFSSQGKELLSVSGPENVHKSIWIILNTQLGERVMQENFGCGIYNQQFEPLRARLVNGLKRTIKNAILLHEPRVKLDQVEVSEDQSSQGVLNIQLQYTVKITNSRFNLVYPFYMDGVQ